jgi:pentatricopeptide repeat protein
MLSPGPLPAASRRPGGAGGPPAGPGRRPPRAPPRAAGVEGPAAGLQVPALKHLAIPRLPSEPAGGEAGSLHVAHAAAVGERAGRRGSSSSGGGGSGDGGGGSGGAHASVDLGAMFLERLSSNGESSSSGGRHAGSPLRVGRHERHIARRREQRPGRRGTHGPAPAGAGGGSGSGNGGSASSSAEASLAASVEEEGFVGGDYEELHAPPGGSWRDARRGRATQQRERRAAAASAAAARASQDAFLDAFIARLLSPQHMWRDDGGPLGGPGRAPAAPAPLPRVEQPLRPAQVEKLAAAPEWKVGSAFLSLCRGGRVTAALQLLEALAAAGSPAIERLSHRDFLAAAAARRAPRAVLRFLQLLPASAAEPRTYNHAMRAAAACGDFEAASGVASLMAVRGVGLDERHRTTLIAAAAAAHNLPAAFRLYAEARAAAAAAAPGSDGARLDGWVYGALVAACAAGIKAAAHDRKEQLVLLERAFGVMDDAAAAHVHLDVPAWNALLMCAGARRAAARGRGGAGTAGPARLRAGAGPRPFPPGLRPHIPCWRAAADPPHPPLRPTPRPPGRSSQLQRAFEVLDMMQSAGMRPNAITYCTLIEACVLAREPDMALRVFQRAQRDGVTRSIHVYTAAVNACMLNGTEADLQAALDIYAAMTRAGVEPDDLLYGSLIALAGAARRLEVAFELVEDMNAGGLRPSAATCSALMYACIQNGNTAAARKVGAPSRSGLGSRVAGGARLPSPNTFLSALAAPAPSHHP